MKLSIETKVAAAVAAGFIALTAGAIGQAGGGDQTGRLNNDDPTNNPGANTHMSQPAYNSSLPGRISAEEDMQRVSDQDVTGKSQRRIQIAKPASRENITRADRLSGGNES